MINASETFAVVSFQSTIVFAVISPRYQLSPAVSSPLAQALGAIESKYEKRFTDSKVNKQFKSQYACLRIRGTPENTDTV